MAIVRMKKLTLIGLDEEKSAVLRAMQELGSVEIQDISDLSGEDIYAAGSAHTGQSDDIEGKLSEVRNAIDLLQKFSKAKKGGMFATRPVVTLKELNEVMSRQADLLDTVAECRRLQEKLTALKSRRVRLQASMDQVEPWLDLDIPFESIGYTDTTNALLCTLRKDNAEAFTGWAEGNELPVSLEVVSESKDQAYCLVVYHTSSEGEVLDRLRELEYERANLSGLKGTARQILEAYKKDMEAAEAEEKLILEGTAQLGESLDSLKILYDGLLVELEKHKAAQRLLNTGKAYILKGWTAERDTKALVEKLSGVTDAIHLTFQDPDDDDVIPVKLVNTPLVEPFEVVTSLYSTPHPKGIDPNALMAPFYFAIFGIMMGDAGYGLIMAVAGTIFTRKMKLKGAARKLGLLMALCGISTVIWGILTGSWFGDMGDRVAPLLGLKTAVVWFNPMEDPLMMLGFCFAFGLLHVFAGMAAKAYMSIRDGHIWNAVFDQGLWFVLIIGLLLIFLPATAVVGKYVAIAGAVGLVLTQGRSKKNIIAKFFSGLLSLYNITGIFSDVLSYSRLFALGLSSAIIGMVFNILASMLGGAWYTFIFAAAVFLVGHIFNLVINILGAFVHASRLQYIEFFSKFFEGGGHAFMPLTIKTKYIDLTN